MMKKITAACVLAIISAITIFSFAFADEAKWRKVVYDERSSIFKGSYSLELGKHECIIILSRDGSELHIFVKDYDYDNTFMSQTIKINSAKHTIEKSVCIVKNDKRMDMGENFGYDIFREKFLMRIGELPLDVRTMFDGHWDIK